MGMGFTDTRLSPTRSPCVLSSEVPELVLDSLAQSYHTGQPCFVRKGILRSYPAVKGSVLTDVNSSLSR